MDETSLASFDTGSADLDRSLAWQASWATFPNTPLPEPMTAAEFDALPATQFDGSTDDRGERLEVTLPVEIPAAPTGVITRADAIDLVVKDPEVSALLSRLPPLDPPGTTEGTAVPSQSGPDDPPTPLPEPPPQGPRKARGLSWKPRVRGGASALPAPTQRSSPLSTRQAP